VRYSQLLPSLLALLLSLAVGYSAWLLLASGWLASGWPALASLLSLEALASGWLASGWLALEWLALALLLALAALLSQPHPVLELLLVLAGELLLDLTETLQPALRPGMAQIAVKVQLAESLRKTVHPGISWAPVKPLRTLLNELAETGQLYQQLHGRPVSVRVCLQDSQMTVPVEAFSRACPLFPLCAFARIFRLHCFAP